MPTPDPPSAYVSKFQPFEPAISTSEEFLPKVKPAA